MSQFGELYDYCQTLKPKVSRRDIQAKVLEITGVASIKATKTALDTSKVRGFFLSASNTEHPLVKAFGTNVIVLARGMNYCWDRFVFTKELMHLFDSEPERTVTDVQFEGLLTEFEVHQPNGHSPQFGSDIKGLWMALACLCPEKYRLEFIDQANKGHIDDYGIALQLRIPKQYVRHLFTPKFKSIVDALVA